MNSKKIKYLTVIGTFSIISTAYFLHANTYYEKLHPLEDIRVDTKNIVKVKPLEVEPKVEKEVVLTPSITVETKHASLKPKEEKKTLVKKVSKDKTSTLTKLLDENRYLDIDSSGNLAPHSKDILEKLIPMLVELEDDSYIEIEGHSATKAYQYQTKRFSEQAALLVQNYLATKLQDRKIIVTSYGDAYPIVDDKKDERNSRVELKIRRR